MSGRLNPAASKPDPKGKGKESEASKSDTTHIWGTSGNTLGRKPPPQDGPVGVGGARVPQPPQRNNRQPARQRSPSPEEEEDWGVDDDDDVIMIDSD